MSSLSMRRGLHEACTSGDHLQYLLLGTEMKSVFYMFVCLAMFVLGFVVDGLITKMPREAMAAGDMMRAERMVRAYYNSKGSVPRSWSDIGCNSLTNRYGNVIEYSVANDYFVTLKAHGFGGGHSLVKNYFVRQFDVRQ